jgi:hypothetical protein
MQPRQLDTDSLQRLLNEGFEVRQWREDDRLHVEIHGTWNHRPTEVDTRIQSLADMRPFSTTLSGTDPANHTRFVQYQAT